MLPRLAMLSSASYLIGLKGMTIITDWPFSFVRRFLRIDLRKGPAFFLMWRLMAFAHPSKV